jgi:hypothetical protein
MNAQDRSLLTQVQKKEISRLYRIISSRLRRCREKELLAEREVLLEMLDTVLKLLNSYIYSRCVTARG